MSPLNSPSLSEMWSMGVEIAGELVAKMQHSAEKIGLWTSACGLSASVARARQPIRQTRIIILVAVQVGMRHTGVTCSLLCWLTGGF
jgi:hypothetical protein